MKTTFSGWRYLWKSMEIRRKLLITLGLLALYRLAAERGRLEAVGCDLLALREAAGRSADWSRFRGDYTLALSDELMAGISWSNAGSPMG